MTLTALPSALWLRSAAELKRPPSRSAVLWPAFEYTVLVFGRRTNPSGHDELVLDPFERAVYGASAANVVSIIEQAKVLDLNPNFVGHLHQRLIERGLFDDYSRPRNASAGLAEDEGLMAARIYQDPWSGSLWPRYVTDDRRRTVPTTTESGRLRLAIGTTGSPIEVRAFYRNRPVPDRPAPSSDDAIQAFAEWSRLQRSHHIEGAMLPKNPSARVLPDSREQVLLCCPNGRGSKGRPQVHDPFGGPEWSPFVRSLVAQSRDFSALDDWLFGRDRPDEPSQLESSDAGNAHWGDSTDSIDHRLRSILGALDAASGSPAGLGQLRLDLEEVAHDALDLLWPVDSLRAQQQLLGDPVEDEALLAKVAVAVGFEPAGVRAGPDLETLAKGLRGPLVERCTALLLLFPADRPGPLHRLAQSVPGLFNILRSPNRHNQTVPTDGLRVAVEALVAVALWSAEDPTQTGEP